MPFVFVESIRVRTDRMVCRVRIAEGCARNSSPSLMSALCAARPKLAAHACVNAKGPGFAAVMNNTPVIHVLEHLIIDFQAEGNTQLFVGASEWEDSVAGIGRVEITFVDDVQALRAINAAVELLNQALDAQSS